MSRPESITSPDTGRDLRLPYLLLTLAILFYGLVVLRTAWVCDDAYITMRTVDNVVQGAGLVWNPGERVQAYSHPLWMLLLTPLYLATGDAYVALLTLSLACSFGAILVLGFLLASTPASGALAILMLGLSRAYVDYSTSGLEDPLTHLLLVVGLALFLKRDLSPRNLFWLALVAGLAAVNRLDNLLLFVPLLFLCMWRLPRLQGVAHAGLGLIPLVLWLGFATFYYGFPWPNPTYARWNAGVGELELLYQGFQYFQFSFSEDPITPLVLVSGVLLPLFTRQARHLAVGAAILLYTVYLLRMGGDAMGGRLLAAPMLCAVALHARLPVTLRRWPEWVHAAAVAGLGAMATLPTYASGADYGAADTNAAWIASSGVADARAMAYPQTGLLRWPGDGEWPEVDAALREPEVRASGVVVARDVGFLGYYGGKQALHILDECGVADPLLARLPSNRAWGMGRLPRSIPAGYEATLAGAGRRIVSEDLAAYHDTLSFIVSGPLFERQRLLEILKIHLGAYDYRIARYLARPSVR